MGLEEFVDMSDEAEKASKIAELKGQYKEFKKTADEKRAKELEKQGWIVFHAKQEGKKVTYFLGKPFPVEQAEEKKGFDPKGLIFIAVGLGILLVVGTFGQQTLFGFEFGIFESIGLFFGIGLTAYGLNMVFDFIPFIGGKGGKK